MKHDAASKKHIWKRVLVLEVIVCYMAALTVISYLRDPDRYRKATDTPILRGADFVQFAGEPAADQGDGFRLLNTAAGNIVGYSARLPLHDRERIQVEFTAVCAAGHEGGILKIDLYEPEAGYDNDEQEETLIMGAGTNEVSVTLSAGENAPDSAMLRACLKSSNEDDNKNESKDLSRGKEFALTIFPQPAEFVEPAK